MANADCIIIQGSNMAECHPVGFQWVAEAKSRGAKVIHVDPRFTRTTALADRHVPIRAGTDVMLLGGLINYVLSNDLWFSEYVRAYTNAASIVTDEFQDAEDLDGLFSGFDPQTGEYDLSSWRYAGHTATGTASGETEAQPGRDPAEGETFGEGGVPLERARPARDETLTHPRSVFQILKRHYARYTPDLIEETCGISAADFE